MSNSTGCLGIFLRLFGAAPAAAPLNYAKRPLLSPAERSFLGVLDLSIDPSFRAFPKVRLADILDVNNRGKQWRIGFNKISAKHVDFIVCDRNTMEVVLAIELDDSSHRRGKALESDAFKDAIFKGAGIPLVRQVAKRSYTAQDLNQVLASLVPHSVQGN